MFHVYIIPKVTLVRAAFWFIYYFTYVCLGSTGGQFNENQSDSGISSFTFV